MSDATSPVVLARAGRRAAATIYERGTRGVRFKDRRDPVFAEAAIREFGRLLDTAPGLLAEQLTASAAAAEELHIRPEQALAEIAQNADDCAASWLRLRVQARAGGLELLAAHNGSPVRLVDAVGMSRAWISAKSDDPEATGKFGIGLKTVVALADSFEVHCEPYHFAVTNQRPEVIAPRAAEPGLFDPDAGHTLLVLRLRSDYDPERIAGWLAEWGAESLLFLRHLSRVELLGEDGEHSAALGLDNVNSELIPLIISDHHANAVCTTLRDSGNPSRVWTRYVVDVPSPPRLRRAHKRTAPTMPLGVAVAEHGQPGQLHAGLPLGEPCSLPFSLHAQFNPDTSRARIKDDGWNAHLIASLSELVSAVAVERFVRGGPGGWLATPVREESAGADQGTRDRFAALVAVVREHVRSQAKVTLGDKPVALDAIVYESRALGSLLTPGDLETLALGRRYLPETARDGERRWRRVLADLGCGQQITTLAALDVLTWPPERMAARTPAWFAQLSDRALSQQATAEPAARLLGARPSVPLAGGERVAPDDVLAAGGTLVRELPASSLAAIFGVAQPVSPEYLDAAAQAAALSAWLEAEVEIAQIPSAIHTLRALARRPARNPLTLSDEQVLALRDALSRVSGAQLEEVGPEIGARVLVRGTLWPARGSRPQREFVRPSEAYLPSRIDGHSDGFAQAARRVPGLRWVESSYAGLLRLPSRDGRRLSARALMTALGARSAPRLRAVPGSATLRGERAAPLLQRLPATQAQAKKRLDSLHAGYWVDHLRDDWVSDDLDAVLDYLNRPSMRAPDKRARARSLVLAIARAWDGYADRATARGVHRYHTWNDLGPVPATWLARLQSDPWLSNERGQRRSPYQLALRSDAFLAAVGEDRSRFCREVAAADVNPEIAEALGFEARPRASTLLETLASLRDQQRRGVLGPDTRMERQALLCYAGLSDFCRPIVRRESGHATVDVDDVSLATLRTRFAAGDGGLILSLGRWWAPRDAFRGRPIFGSRRPVVPPGPDALWNALGIGAPGLVDCVQMLDELATVPPESSDQGVLIDVYGQLNSLLEPMQRPPRSLRELPLWTGRWTCDRPVYAVAQPAIAARLGEMVPVWQPPGSLTPDAVACLLGASGVELLDPATFVVGGVPQGSYSMGGRLRAHWRAAVREFGNLLASVDAGAHRSLRCSWADLEEAPLAHSASLEVSVPLPGGAEYGVRVRSFAQPAPLLIAYAGIDDLGAYDSGGRAMVALFEAGDADKVAFAWSEAFKRANPENLTDAIRLAREQPARSTSADDLAEQAAAAVGRGRLPAAEPPSGLAARPAPSRSRLTSPPSLPLVRRLKTLEELDFGSAMVAVVRVGETDGTTRGREVRPLLAAGTLSQDERLSRSAGGVGSRLGVRSFSIAQQEELGFELLANILGNVRGHELGDLRHLQAAGADGIDGLRHFVEMKAHGAEILDPVSLTRSEIQRAIEQGPNFVLALVGGLEAGSGDWRVLLVPDPIRVLDVVAGTDLQLTGFERRRAVELRGQGPQDQQSTEAVG